MTGDGVNGSHFVAIFYQEISFLNQLTFLLQSLSHSAEPQPVFACKHWTFGGCSFHTHSWDHNLVILKSTRTVLHKYFIDFFAYVTTSFEYVTFMILLLNLPIFAKILISQWKKASTLQEIEVVDEESDLHDETYILSYLQYKQRTNRDIVKRIMHTRKLNYSSENRHLSMVTDEKQQTDNKRQLFFVSEDMKKWRNKTFEFVFIQTDWTEKENQGCSSCHWCLSHTSSLAKWKTNVSN